MAVVPGNHHLGAGNRGHYPGTLSKDHLPAVLSCFDFHAGSHQGCLRAEQRHRLPLHIGSHEGTIGIIML